MADAETDALLDDLAEASRSERAREIFKFDAFPYQSEILDADAPNVSVNCGRQVGKTEIGGLIPADFVLRHPGEDAMIAARFQETADEMFRRTKQHLATADDRFGEVFPNGVGLEKQNQTTYELDTGARIMSRPLPTDAKQARGKLPKCVVIDESAIVEDAVYERVIEPMFATHGDDHEFYLMSTPRGKQGYHYRRHRDADSHPQWAAFHVPTSANPLVGEDWLETKRTETDELTWLQEYEGEFIDTGNSYLPTALVAGCMPGRHDGTAPGQEPAIEPTPDAPAWLGVDPARSGDDRSVFTSVDAQGRVFDVQAWDTQTVPEAVGQIKTLDEHHGYQAIAVDENGLGGGVVDFSNEGLSNVSPVTFSSKSKQRMYTNLKKALEDEQLTLPNNDRLFHELTALQYDFTQNGILRVEHPPGGHDDHADSLALAVDAWQRNDRAGAIVRSTVTPSGSGGSRSRASRNRKSGRQRNSNRRR